MLQKYFGSMCDRRVPRSHVNETQRSQVGLQKYFCSITSARLTSAFAAARSEKLNPDNCKGGCSYEGERAAAMRAFTILLRTLHQVSGTVYQKIYVLITLAVDNSFVN